MSNSSNNTSGGIGFAGLLTSVFITLKLCGVIAWSWWWVCSPLWVGFALVFTILLLIGIGTLIVVCLPDKKTRR